MLFKGQKILKLSIPEFGITFLDSYKYIKASLQKCAKMFSLDIGKGTFPLKSNIRKNYNLNSIPPFHVFINENDSEQAINEKRKFWLTRRKTPWNFRKEISLYCNLDCLVLIKICLRFCFEWIDMQRHMWDFFGKSGQDNPSFRYFFPFENRFCTLGGKYKCLIDLSY